MVMTNTNPDTKKILRALPQDPEPSIPQMVTACTRATSMEQTVAAAKLSGGTPNISVTVSYKEKNFNLSMMADTGRFTCRQTSPPCRPSCPGIGLPVEKEKQEGDVAKPGCKDAHYTQIYPLDRADKHFVHKCTPTLPKGPLLARSHCLLPTADIMRVGFRPFLTPPFFAIILPFSLPLALLLHLLLLFPILLLPLQPIKKREVSEKV
ncbi:uncharacterized protein LOC115916522 [Camarhynchus parvulus]|uniref:uncharacterized protein LOC115916522 n=1 Tax=Geospiza parvula TaxID=87175 RepID=UPI001237E439|nr:uncharacterized protein LOC115916522 [Camarhynchus parvulus]